MNVEIQGNINPLVSPHRLISSNPGACVSVGNKLGSIPPTVHPIKAIRKKKHVTPNINPPPKEVIHAIRLVFNVEINVIKKKNTIQAQGKIELYKESDV